MTHTIRYRWCCALLGVGLLAWGSLAGAQSPPSELREALMTSKCSTWWQGYVPELEKICSIETDSVCQAVLKFLRNCQPGGEAGPLRWNGSPGKIDGHFKVVPPEGIVLGETGVVEREERYKVAP